MSRFIQCCAEWYYAECRYAECHYGECRSVIYFSLGRQSIKFRNIDTWAQFNKTFYGRNLRISIIT
jgi:hypothetical protein